MSVPSRLRYEILRRDNHTCRYCGGRVPDVVLTVDHVKPTVLGGTDAPSNLVAACRDCNSGKTSSSPDAALVADVSADAIRWAAAMRLAAEQAEKERDDDRSRLEPWHAKWFAVYKHTMGSSYDFPVDWQTTIARFLDAGLPMDVLLHAADVALSARGVQARFPYFVGIANNKLRDLEERAASLLTGPLERGMEKSVSYAEYLHGALSAVVDQPSVGSFPRAL